MISHGTLKMFPFKPTIISDASFIGGRGEIKSKKKKLNFAKDSYRYVVGPDTGGVVLCVTCGKVSTKSYQDNDDITIITSRCTKLRVT